MRTIILALALIFGLGNSNDEIQSLIDNEEYSQAFARASELAATGDPSAHNWLGWLYEEGKGIEIDLPLAVYHYRIAAASQENHASWRLGVLIDQGQAAGTLEEAVALFKSVAEKEYTNAIVSLAVMQATGRGTSQDYPAALESYMRAAALGDGGGLRGVGIMMYLGQGLEPNKEEAAAWFLVSAARGNPDGENSFQLVMSELEGIDPTIIAKRAKEIAANLELEVNITILDEDDPATLR
ncbi:MAG: tetratricopeptide repeat protein [Pseudomonadota bacterium]